MTVARQTATGALGSAALRHARDASRLLEPPVSPDQARHLAGFGPECAREAALRQLATEDWRRRLGHQAGSHAVVEWLLSVDPRSRRAVLAGAPDAGWRPDDRYCATGTWSVDVVRGFVSACAEDALAVTTRLWTLGW